MFNDNSQHDDDISMPESLEQWLEQQAAADGISQERLFSQLVSAYWALNEMQEMLDEFDDENLSINRPSGENTEEVRERLDELEHQLETEAERRQSLDPLVEAIASHLAELEGKLEELAVEAGKAHNSLDQKHESVAEQVDALTEELEQEREKRATETQELRAGQEQIKTRLDSEFEDLETILTYLVSRTDELESDTSDMDAKHEEALTRFRWERDTLEYIKRKATDANTRSGECQSCGEVIDLGMLSRPYCPECENTLTGIKEEQKWLFFSNVIVTTENSSQGQSARESTRPSYQSGRSRPASGEEQFPEEPTQPGSDGGSGQDKEETPEDIRDPESDDTGSGSAQYREESGLGTPDTGNAEDTDWGDASFERAAINEKQSGGTTESHSQAEEEKSPTARGQNGDRSEERTADEEGGSEESGLDQSPFGDLSDLTSEE